MVNEIIDVRLHTKGFPQEEVNNYMRQRTARLNKQKEEERAQRALLRQEKEKAEAASKVQEGTSNGVDKTGKEETPEDKKLTKDSGNTKSDGKIVHFEATSSASKPDAKEKQTKETCAATVTSKAAGPVDMGPSCDPKPNQKLATTASVKVQSVAEKGEALAKTEVQVNANLDPAIRAKFDAALKARRDASGFNYNFPAEWPAELKEKITKMYDVIGKFHEYVFPNEPQTRKTPFVVPTGGLTKCACRPGCKYTLPEPAYRSTVKQEYELFTGTIKKNTKNARKVRKN